MNTPRRGDDLSRPAIGATASLLAALVAVTACRRSVSPAAGSDASVAPALEAPLAPGVPCGALGCVQLDSPADALQLVLAPDTQVLAIGEAHAPRGATAESATKRFTRDLLPRLRDRASDLLVELLLPPGSCAAATDDVRRKQAPATSQQSAANPSEYVTMGERARALGIVPDMLRPSCADLDGVRDAGDDAIDASLRMIARLSETQAHRLLARDARSDRDRGKLVVLYGGLLHNDLDPAPDRRAWTYAPALDAATGGRFVALDLIIPEFIGDDATWRALPWVPHYDRARLGRKTTLFRVGPKAFVVVFPEGAPG